MIIKNSFLSKLFSSGGCIIMAIVIFSIIPFITSASVSANSDSISATFTLEQNSDDHFKAHITLQNTLRIPLNHWTLWLNSVRPIQQVTGATIIKQVGDFYGLASTSENSVIPAGGSVTIHIEGQHHIEKYSDAPAGYFLTTRDTQGQESKPLSINVQNVLLPWKPAPGEDEYSRNNTKNQTAIEGNPVQPSAMKPEQSLANTLIVPLPVQLEIEQGEFILKSDTKILAQAGNKEALETAQFFADAIRPATGYDLKIQAKNPDENPQSLKNAIFFTYEGATSDLGSEGYTLDITPQNIIIRANTAAGLFYGMQSLRQLFPAQIFSNSLQNNIQWISPSVKIKDYPRFTYRGLHLDVARHFIPADQVKRLLDLMAIHKLNTFHWHLTDDEGWRIQINHYPQLTNIGAWRGYYETLPPAMGSGWQKYGGFYTQDQVKDIVDYAAQRHITIIPEIDMPGHARAMIQSLPDQLIDPTDKSTYTSVQGYHDNVLSPCIESTYEVINNIMGELATLFPGEYIHVGADERPEGAWEKSPKCTALMQSAGLTDAAQLQNYFLRKVQAIIESKNKKMAAWEEVIHGGSMSPNTRVYAWTGVDSGIKAAEAGYPVVMIPAQFLYFDLAYNADPEEAGYNWAGYVDTFSAYSYSPITANMTPEVVSKILGVQGALWSELIDSKDRLDYMAFPKVAALAEVAWTPANRRNWINFSQRLGKYYLPALDYYGVKYRLSLPGISIVNNILNSNIEFPGLETRYTTDGSTPTSNSSLYQTPVSVPSTNIKMMSFDQNQRGSRVSIYYGN